MTADDIRAIPKQFQEEIEREQPLGGIRYSRIFWYASLVVAELAAQVAELNEHLRTRRTTEL